MKQRLLYNFSIICVALFITGISAGQQMTGNAGMLSDFSETIVAPTDNTGSIFTIGTGTTLNESTPVNARRRYSFSQTLYLKSELTFGNKAINQIAYRYGGTKASLPLEIEVWIGHTTLTQLSATEQLTNSVKVYDGPWVLSAGQAYTPIEIDPFIYNNVDNLLITVFEKNQSSGATADKFYSSAVPTGKKYCLGKYTSGWPYDPANLPASTTIAYRSNIWLWVDDLPTGPAVFEITPTNLDFGQVETGEYKTMNVKVKNTGSEAMTITGFSSTNPNFSVANISFPLTLTMLQQKLIEIKYESINPGFEDGVVTFLMDPLIGGTKEVQVSAESVVPLVVSDFPFFEGFDNGLPAGWKNRKIEGDGWFFPSLPYPYAYSYFVNDKGRKAIMITSQFDFTGIESAKLALNHRVYAYDTGWYDRIMVSPDKINWTIIQEYTVGWDPDGYRYEEIDLTPAVSGGKFFLAFEVNYPMLLPFVYEAVWEIDDLTITVVAPKYNVTFVVEDEGGNPLTNAIVTLDGNTNAAGDYLFEDIEAGTHDYTVELGGYITATGQVEVVDQDIEETVVLTQPLIITEFPWFEGFDGGALPDGWKNVVNEGNGFTFATSPFSHTFIYYFGDLQRNAQLETPLFNLNGLNPVKLGINHRIYAYETGWSHKILISADGTNWDVLAEFTEGFEPDDYRYMEFDITPTKAGEQVYLAFAVDYPLLPDYYEVVWEIESVTVFEPISVFNVNFVVEDEGGNPLTNAIVTLDGNTNAAGDYLFEDIEAGTHDYTVELGGYITATGQVEVVDQDIEETVVLTQPLIITEFPWVEGFDGGALPDGWKNVVNEGNGWAFALNPYSHTYNYYFGDLQRNSMLITPLLDLGGLDHAVLGIFHRIYAYGEGWSHKILMSSDGINWDVLQEFTIGFDPDINQYMEFDITPAKDAGQVYLAFAVDYPMLPDYYEVVWEIVDITVFEPIPVFDVTFVVEDDGGNPLNDAIVTLNGVANSAGNFVFEELEAGIYDYTVELDGYIAAEGQVEVVDQEVLETVILKTGQYVNLIEGWSLISSYMTPENPMLESLFANQIQNESMVFMLNPEGIFWPGHNINTMGDWDSHSAYKVKMSATEVVGIAGTMVENMTVDLNVGVNYLPVLSKENVIASDLFAQVPGLMYAFDLTGGLIYWPEGGIYSLEVLVPGKGYIVGMNTPGTVSYANLDKAPGVNFTLASNYPADFPEIINTGSAHLISISYEALAASLEKGDFIAAFDEQNRCVGAVQYPGTANNLGLIVFGDDYTTDVKDGLSAGEEITLRCIKSASHDNFGITPMWNTAMPNSGYYSENGLSAISELKLSPLNITNPSFGVANVYPNPAKDIVHFNLQKAETALVEIFDKMGRLVWKSEINSNENSCDVSQFGSGVYIVKISTQHQILLVSKLILE